MVCKKLQIKQTNQNKAGTRQAQGLQLGMDFDIGRKY